MIEPLLIVAGGLLGSAHCVGMCGGFVLTLGTTTRSWQSNLARQISYALGRIFVYTFLGGFAGFAGWHLGRGGWFVFAQATLAVLAGVFLIAEGLFSAGLIPRPFAGQKTCPGANVFGQLLRARDLSNVFLGGLANGLLPCGLVYAYLALAASWGGPLGGMAVMALFGLGTIPSMVMTGMSGSLLGVSFRRRLFLIAAWCMIVTGLLSLYRGYAFLTLPPDAEPTCPYCADDVQS